MRIAKAPFRFMRASTMTRITGLRATTLAELLDNLKACSDASIFNHTFQSLEQHHFLTQGFSNDFAQWALASCNEPQLAERLTALDIRNYESLAALRGELIGAMGSYLQRMPDAAYRRAFEPFHFCETVTVTLPMELEARTLGEFCQALRHVTTHTLHYHFVASRLREPLTYNDFSHWLEDSLELKELADRIDQVDIYTNTLEDVRQRILEEVSLWLAT